MKLLRLFCLCSIILSAASCSKEELDDIGSIMFTSDVDFEFRLFDDKGNQVARDWYEAGKPPTVVHLKSTGFYVLLATRQDTKAQKKEPLRYSGGTYEYFVEF